MNVEARLDRGIQMPRGKEGVLVVDDEPLVRNLVDDVLKGLGYDLTVAAGGDEALRIARKRGIGRVQLLVADFSLPGRSGVEVAGLVRLLQPGLRVLFISGYPEEHMDLGKDQDPYVSFLEKPFSAMALACKVRDLLDR